MRGLILQEENKHHSFFGKLFCSMRESLSTYNWLITDIMCYPLHEQYRDMFTKQYLWISGTELTYLLEQEDFQWIWAVISGFETRWSLNEVLKYPLPYANGYLGFWTNPVSIQHPLAEVELTAWDGLCTLFISRRNELINKIQQLYPLAQDLSEYNAE